VIVIQGDSKRWTQLNRKRRHNTRNTISLYIMYVSTMLYSIVNFTYPIIRLHVSTVCQSSSGLTHISYHMLFAHFGIP